jgi:hypothetical protein
MGRPLRSDRFVASFGGTTAGKIAVTGYRPSGGSLVSSVSAYIISQRGSRLFKIHLEDSSEAVYELKAVAPDSLANTSNQFCVQVILNDSTVAYVDKFYNNTVHYVTAAGAAGTVTYTLGVEGTDEGGGSGSGTGSVDVR